MMYEAIPAEASIAIPYITQLVACFFCHGLLTVGWGPNNGSQTEQELALIVVLPLMLNDDGKDDDGDDVWRWSIMMFVDLHFRTNA